MKPFLAETLPPADLQWEPLIPWIGRANRALAEYNGVLYALPDPGLLLSPLTTREAVLSSKIEGTQATFGEVLNYEAGQEPQQASKRQDIQEIMNYRSALLQAERALELRPFNLNLLLAIHGTLLDSVRGRDKGRGEFRREQNWIGAAGCTIEEAQFVPPAPGEPLMQALYAWESYYHAEAPDPLVHLALVHAQFEILHPFVDGNGRLGRILIPLYLHEQKVLRSPVFYLSEYLEAHREEYIERLRQIGREPGAWNRWIQFFLHALITQAEANVQKARAIHDLYDRLKREVLVATRSQFAVPLLDLMFRQPVFQSSSLFQMPSMPSRPMIVTLLRQLREAGVLKVVAEGRGARAQVLALAELVNLCEGKTVV